MGIHIYPYMWNSKKVYIDRYISYIVKRITMVAIHLNDFEHLNSTTESIYELGNLNVLIILKDGTNFTNWDDVKNNDDIIYISEDLFGKTNLNGRYKGLKNLKAIVTLGVGNVETMSEMFSGCESLEEISTLSSWDVSNVYDMSYMFNECSSLQNIDALSNWNVSNVTNMACLFLGCASLEDLSPLSGWDVGNVTDMHYLFSYCTHLKDISAVSEWNVSNVLDVGCLFEFCTLLEDISALENWNLSNVFNITAMFRGCSSLKNISPLKSWDLAKMTRNKSLLAIFANCNSLKNISPLKSWDLSNITRIEGLFEDCISLKSISPLKKWDVSNVVSFSYLFRGCSLLSDISPLKSWDISSADEMDGMFDGCSSLENISALKSWDVSNVKSLNGMFNNCSALVDISGIENWELSKDASLDFIFNECNALTEYPLWFETEVIKNPHFDSKIRHKIINGLDTSFFTSFDLNSLDEDSQLFMVAACNNQSILAYIVDRSNYKFIQEKALEKINDEEILTDIAIHDHNCDISNDGGNLKFYFYNRENALVKIRNTYNLIKIAKEVPYILVNMEYIARYIDLEEHWVDIVINAQSPDVRLFALSYITTISSFERIMLESDDERILKIVNFRFNSNP